jgi:D-glycero-D-manno-heptose 1,7-bisphosphate phosphatase
MLKLSDIDSEWTLFLDRDGVINKDKSPYTLNPEQFEFYDGVPEAIMQLNKIFHRVFIITNQRGVGRKMMTETDLLNIHHKMMEGITRAGGRIEKIYYCTAVDDADPNRKPNPGMALQAMKENPGIVPHQSIIVGNNISDMQFGRNAGFHTMLVQNTGTKVNLPHPLVDLQYPTLPDFADALVALKKQ